MSTKKVAQASVSEEETRRIEEENRRKAASIERKREELRELEERKKKQAEAGEEAQRKLNKKKGNANLYYYATFGVLGFLLLYVIVMLFLNQTAPLHKTATIDLKRIEEHNHNFPWRQAANKFFEGTTLADSKKIINTSFASHSNLVRCTTDDSIVTPDSFDVRNQWPKCILPTANQQKTCGSSYAFGVASTATERLCINSKTQKLNPLSPQDLLSCDAANTGCKGGYLNVALDYARNKGLVEETCLPYQADTETFKATCDKPCENAVRHKIDSYCLLFGEEDIKREIFKNGPVVSVTQVHTDFLTYSEGVYTKGDEVPRFSGYQTVKIVGWGVETGEANEPNKGNKYWIVQNSWGEDWGDKGYAKVSVGQEFMFEQYAYAVKVRNENEAPRQPRKPQVKAPEPEEDKHQSFNDNTANTENVEHEEVK